MGERIIQLHHQSRQNTDFVDEQIDLIPHILPCSFVKCYEDVNIVTWQRDLSQSLQDSVSDFLAAKPTFQSTLIVTPESALTDVQKAIGESNQAELAENIAELVEMFCSLFDRLSSDRKAVFPFSAMLTLVNASG